MHDHAGAVPVNPAPALPVIAGARWFDGQNRPFTLRIECPLAFEEMVAALYGVVEPAEITGDEELCGCVAVTLAIEGMHSLARRAEQIRSDERGGALASPKFLALCRQRVASLLAA
jgi:hypothetical protein